MIVKKKYGTHDAEHDIAVADAAMSECAWTGRAGVHTRRVCRRAGVWAGEVGRQAGKRHAWH